MPSTDESVSIAFVHHANQYLIGDGYENRQGISEIAQGYASILFLHEKYHIPAALHLSGTLLETLAWHCPWFLQMVSELAERGTVELLGGTYSENLMPLFDPSFNRRQLALFLEVFARHFPRFALPRVAWVPERAWETKTLAPVLTNAALANQGYRAVLLDERLALRANERAVYDAKAPYCTGGEIRTDIAHALAEPFWIEGSQKLAALPISSLLRYTIPPRETAGRIQWESWLEAAWQNRSGQSLWIYADDLERTAGVGGWERAGLARYETLLGWVSEERRLRPLPLSTFLDERPPTRAREVDPGAFYELEIESQAGPGGRKWWGAPDFVESRISFEKARAALEIAEPSRLEPRLFSLAWKHLLASSYETAWHEHREGNIEPAPWAKALASHSRAALPILAAAAWCYHHDPSPRVFIRDIDGDGESECILTGRRLFAVLTPRWGGRLIYLFSHQGRGLVGNPTDDWNFQEELNRHMAVPANHPGALADLGGENDRYQVAETVEEEDRVSCRLLNITPGSPFEGMEKIVSLDVNASELEVRYVLPRGLERVTTQAALSPDYAELLRSGGNSAVFFEEGSTRGVTFAGTRSWIRAHFGARWEIEPPVRIPHAWLYRLQLGRDAVIRIGGADEP